MGLYDRDYMRQRRAPAAKRATWRVTSQWTRIVIVVAVLGAIFIFSDYLLERRHAMPFPPTGAVQWYGQTSGRDTAPLAVAAPPGRNRNYVVRLDDWASNSPVALIPVRGGETASLQVPLGRYRVTMANGTTWQGSARMFGGAGEVRIAIAPLEFFRTNNETTGHTIDLTGRLDGNMETRPASFF